MEFVGLQAEDFEVFEVPGLENRMLALKSYLRPKLEQLGQDIGAYLSNLLNVPMYAHVAKHARRTVNPPNDSWVAFCPDKRGYKKYPHFQIGAWQTHAFATFGLIYESAYRVQYAHQLEQNATEVLAQIPAEYVWIPNHMDPNVIPASEVDEQRLRELANRLVHQRQGELLVGMQMNKKEAIHLSAEQFIYKIEECFKTLLPLYHMAYSEVLQK